MGTTIQNRVHYCCVSKDNQILYAYNGGGDQHNNDSLAALCLEKTPPLHKWYFETIRNRTFVFLMEDGFVYFAIVDHVLKKSNVLDFLEQLKDEFKKGNRKNSRGGSNAQDQIVRKLVASLEGVAVSNELACTSPITIDVAEGNNSTKAPLLGRFNKQEKKKKGKDHVNTLRGIELEEQRVNVTDGSNVLSTEEAIYVPRRGRRSGGGGGGGSQSIERKWRRQVKIVLAIDAAICLTLFGVWLAICKGIECTRS